MFNKEKFSKILNNIYKTYPNQRDFAHAMGTSRGYLSQYINMKFDNPPTPKILEKIATASKGITTYKELMYICGYIETKRTPIESRAIKGLEQMVEMQVMGYSLIDIVLNYVKRLEGKVGDEIAEDKK